MTNFDQMKTILGLDLGTNSIGWALIRHDFEEKEGEILGMGSRILPMPQDVLGKFDTGQSISQTAGRTAFRGNRRLLERDLLRRERLHRVLNILGFLPAHYADAIDFEQRLGQFKKEREPKIAYKEGLSKKFEFIFQDSFNEMVADFRKTQPQLFYLKSNGQETKIPYDWTIYYLRKKALSRKIEKEELAWILLNFNQKRGYYQLRGEEEKVEDNKNESFEVLTVSQVVDSGDKRKGKDLILYDVYFENGWKYDRQVVKPEEWYGKTKEFIVTTKTLASGEIKRSFKEVDSERDWIAIKQKTEQDIAVSDKMVGTYIYDKLLQNPNQKIRGKLIRTIERKFYKDELRAILDKQIEFHPELQDRELYHASVSELYTNNDAHRNNIAKRDFTYLFLDDIIFYQRPLKSKKSTISKCPLEFRSFKKEDGTIKKEGVRCIAKSDPLYQEFRLLQWMKNLRIFRKDDKQDVDITDELLPSVAHREELFTWLNDKSEINQKTFLKYVPFNLEEKIRQQIGIEQFRIFKKDKEQDIHTYYRWNYVEDKTYPLNEIRGEILKRLKKADINPDFLNKETEAHLWHILYSVEDRDEVMSALQKFAVKHNLPESFVDTFRKYPRIEREYGAFSAKAIKKLLPLLRFGKWWDFSAIDEGTRGRIDKILTGEYDDHIKSRVRDKAINLTKNEDFQNLPLWLSCYVVYDRHAESGDVKFWRNAEDIELLEQHSLRNPIVEQVINETLQTIKDIWSYYGNGEENFFNEIHVELGREMKNPADKRKKISERVTENENTNTRVKAILTELLNDGDHNVRPYSPVHQEIMKIYEEGVYGGEGKEETLVEIDQIRKKSQPAAAEIKRYTLWLEQGYKSPYTGKMIPLSRLFTPDYQIEHVIPQSRFFDDSLSNKIICESEVNSLKDNQLAYEFIKNNKGLKIELSRGEIVELLDPEAYEENVKKHFSGNKLKSKREKLLLDEIPDSFIERQMNDSRYISKVVKSLLSNIVRQEGEEEGIAKDIVVSSGGITSRLKQDWGLNDIWNSLITPRFERLNRMAGYEKYGAWENKDGKKVFQISNIEPELLKLNKKRIDHRHHALDALIVACSSRNHVNYLNNDNANGKDRTKPARYDLRAKLRKIEEIEIEKAVDGEINKKKIKVAKEFLKPWKTFTQEAKNELQGIVVSFKKNNRVINKTVNYYQRWERQADGSMKKVFVKQTKGDNWAIRRPLHVPMPYGLKEYTFDNLKIAENVGKRNLISDDFVRKQVENVFIENNEKVTLAKNYLKKHPIKNLNGEEVITTDFLVHNKKFRKRKPISELSNRSSQGGLRTLDQMIKFLNKVADKKLKDDLFRHLKENGNDIDRAFSADGIEKFNSKRDIPVYKLPIAESGDKRFALGYQIGNKHKWVEAESGTNLFFAIYVDEEGKRSYKTIPFNEVIEHQKWRATLAKQERSRVPLIPVTQDGGRLLFELLPNDLVYVPTVEEQENPHKVDIGNLDKEQVQRIYKIVSFTGNRLYAIPVSIAKSIVDKVEFTQLNKIESTDDGQSIKSVCWKLETDRLGNIKKVIGQNAHYLNDRNTDFLQESTTTYYSKNMQLFTTLEEMNEMDARDLSKLSPDDHIRNATELNKNIFRKSLDNPMDKKLKFRE